MKRIIAFTAVVMIACTSFAQGSDITGILQSVLSEAKQHTEEAETPQAANSLLNSQSMSRLGAISSFGGMTSALIPGRGTGIIAGATLASTSPDDIKGSPVTQYHVGIMTQVPLFLGFLLEPGIMYNMKGTYVKDKISNSTIDTSVGYLEIPIQLQWGIRIRNVRPYVFAEPFVGYALNGKAVYQQYKEIGGNAGLLGEIAGIAADEENLIEIQNQAMNRIEYGMGTGAGIEFSSRLQIMARYYRNMGNLFNAEGEIADIKTEFLESLKNYNSFSGLSVSIAFFF